MSVTPDEGRTRDCHSSATMHALDELVHRFLTWPVPADVYPDGTPGQMGRTGTNLLTAEQARTMLAHVLGVGEQAMTREWCAAYPASAAWMIDALARRIDALYAELARLRAELAEWQTMDNSLRAELEREAKRLAFLFQAHRTTSNALVEAELRVFNGESLTLDEARTAIDEAMRCTLAQEPPA